MSTQVLKGSVHAVWPAPGLPSTLSTLRPTWLHLDCGLPLEGQDGDSVLPGYLEAAQASWTHRKPLCLSDPSFLIALRPRKGKGHRGQEQPSGPPVEAERGWLLGSSSACVGCAAEKRGAPHPALGDGPAALCPRPPADGPSVWHVECSVRPLTGGLTD